MGRPIKPKYIGKYNAGDDAGANLASVAMTAGGSGYYAANVTVVFSAPTEASGTQATGTAIISANAAQVITGVTITNAGSGYAGTATVTFGGPNTSPAFGTVTLKSEVNPSIKCYANIAGNGSTTTQLGDILRQKSGHRYLVQTSQGTSVCSLAAAANSALISTTTDGKMNIAAFDSAGGTYWVKKLWDRTVTLVPVTGTQYAANVKVAWTLGAATLNVGTSTSPAANATVTLDHI